MTYKVVGERVFAQPTYSQDSGAERILFSLVAATITMKIDRLFAELANYVVTMPNDQPIVIFEKSTGRPH